MTFLIFDPQNDLIFLHLEPSFQQFLLDSDLISLPGDVNNNNHNHHHSDDNDSLSNSLSNTISNSLSRSLSIDNNSIVNSLSTNRTISESFRNNNFDNNNPKNDTSGSAEPEDQTGNSHDFAGNGSYHSYTGNSYTGNSSETSQNFNADIDHETALKFSLTLLLAPFVSTKRQMDDEASLSETASLSDHFNKPEMEPLSESVDIRFDSIPNTCISYQNCHQFMFIHLSPNYPTSPAFTKPAGSALQSAYLDRKLTTFVRLTFFVFGNALYNMSRHIRELRLLLELVNKWAELSGELCFLFEGLELLSLGSQLPVQISRSVGHVEQLIRLYTQNDAQHVNERATGLLLMFHDKLIYKHLSQGTNFRQEDLLSLYLLSQLETPTPTPSPNPTNSGTPTIPEMVT